MHVAYPPLPFATSAAVLRFFSRCQAISLSSSAYTSSFAGKNRGKEHSSLEELRFFFTQNSLAKTGFEGEQRASHFCSTSASMTGTTMKPEDVENEQQHPPTSSVKIPLNTHSIRKAYMNLEEPFLLERNMHACPFEQFHCWFENVIQNVDLKQQEVNAFALSTVSSSGQPSSRMLLLKGYSKEGFVFFTHSLSRKGREMAGNTLAAMLFYWPRVDRQVRVEGRVCMLNAQIAEEYWRKRPISTRIGSKLSEQSAEIPSRDFLTEKQKILEEMCARDGEEVITKPADWLGYALQPDYFEFWQGQSNRVHDRIIYELEERHNEAGKNDGSSNTDDNEGGESSGWTMKRLAP